MNPSLYTPEEIAEKLTAGHHFLKTVMSKEKLFVLGGKDDLAAVTSFNRVRADRTSKQELDDLRAAIERDLRDAGISGLSVDRVRHSL